ncbi:DNAJ protein JJJ1 homolog [Phoenix dactylifera]|uniref:DNAJ protein JJJ1 homolog n=1 Tax=Phoenix dactylifera TaxID=42345 RepID=A0A8B7C496_PHODC|nr:DNAJ protein JJJ1 homolog [Phoenix dactylifera]
MAEGRKRCLYEVLGVRRDCSQDEIRAAYKRLALQLHPDKLAASASRTSAADATAAFQELRHAYEVLSDPKERAWYDSHRSQILFSDPSSTSKSHRPSAFFDLDLYAFFSNSAFSGYSDAGRGFYKVYGDLFAKVYAQELWFAKELGLGADAVAPVPLIGNLDSPYPQVTAFYNYWLGFCTVMDFGWVDEYDASMGPNRRTRRAMEEENKKARKKAKREYNDTVRGLAAFVKKRDKRVIDMMVKRNLEEEKRRAEEKARKKEEERKKMERARMYEEPEWAKIEEEEEEMVMRRGFDDLEEEDDQKKKKKKGAGEEFYCVVCNKKFKSDKQWKNHEQSKKHRDKVAELRMTLEEEDKLLEEEGDDEGVHVEFDYEPPESEESDMVDELCEELREEIRLQEDGNDDEDLEDSDQKVGLDDEVSILEAMVSGHKNRKNYSQDLHNSTSNYDHYLDNDEQNSTGYDSKRSRRNRASKRWTGADMYDEATRQGIGESQWEDSEVQNQEDNIEDKKEGPSSPLEEVATRSKGGRATGKNQKSKKQPVDGKGAGRKDTAGDSKNSSKGRKQKATSKALSNACGTCGESFESRNKLFAHIGATGHAMLKSW